MRAGGVGSHPDPAFPHNHRIEPGPLSGLAFGYEGVKIELITPVDCPLQWYGQTETHVPAPSDHPGFGMPQRVFVSDHVIAGTG